MYCPNPDCPDRRATGRPGEYRDDVAACPVCGTALSSGTWDDLAAAEPPRGGGAYADRGEDVEVLRTADRGAVALASAALDEAGIAFRKQTEGPSGIIVGSHGGEAAPGAEDVLLVAASDRTMARSVVESALADVPELEADGHYEFDGVEAEEEKTNVPAAPGSWLTRAALTVVRLVFLLLLLLGVAAVVRIVISG